MIFCTVGRTGMAVLTGDCGAASTVTDGIHNIRLARIMAGGTIRMEVDALLCSSGNMTAVAIGRVSKEIMRTRYIARCGAMRRSVAGTTTRWITWGKSSIDSCLHLRPGTLMTGGAGIRTVDGQIMDRLDTGFACTQFRMTVNTARILDNIM